MTSLTTLELAQKIAVAVLTDAYDSGVCGDWKRVCTPAVTSRIGLTGILLDPPYDDHGHLYATSRGGDDISTTVRDWAVYRGDDPDMRIALCGYEGEHDMPANWECVGWKAQGG